MYPELFHIGSFSVRVFGLTMALSFVFGVLYVRATVARDHRDFTPFLTTAYMLMIGGVIGARLGYVVLHLDEFSGHWLDAVNPFHGAEVGLAGLNLYGGVLLAIVLAWIYLKTSGLSTLDVFDYFAPALGLGLGITRIGCFCNGCCFGTPTTLPWGVHFPVGSLPWYTYGDTALHPAQLYSSLYGLLLFVYLHQLLKRRLFFGQVLAVLFMVEAVFRFAIEEVRYYEQAMVFYLGGYEITYNQVVSVGLFAAGVILFVRQYRETKRLAA